MRLGRSLHSTGDEMNQRFSRRMLWVVVPLLLGLSQALIYAEPLPLNRAVQLALTHSTGSAISSADVQRTYAAYREIRNNYVPQLIVGSGLGYSYGFPLTLEGSAPALVNVVAQSTVFNPAQQQFMKAAKIEMQASQAQSKDQRNAVIQDVCLTYAELVKWQSRLERLQKDEADASQLENAVLQRVQEGVDSATDLNRAKLVAARTRLHIVETRGSAELLRRHLSALTGVPVSEIEIVRETIPALPAMSQDDASSRAAAASPAVQSAEQHASAEALRASGEHRALLPSLDLSAQYARLAKYNNYDEFYRRFQADNVTFGVAIRFPIFNFSQRARAQGADAEAVKAKKQAEATRNQVSEETLKLQRASEQLAAAREVAQLEYELAQGSVNAAQTRIDAGTGTLHDLADARVQASERYLQLQDADFEYQRARVTLLRATGELEGWALATAPTQP